MKFERKYKRVTIIVETFYQPILDIDLDLD